MNKCKIHDNLITHICCSSECLQILCGKCVVEHLAFHKSKVTWPELFTLEELRNFCKSKLEFAISKSDNLIKDVQIKKSQEQALQKKINEELIYLNRKRILSFIDDYFKSLELYVNKECEKFVTKIDFSIGDLNEKKNGIKQQYEIIENSQGFEGLLQIFQTDYQKNISDYDESFNDLLKAKYIVSFKESNMEVFRHKFFELINDVLIDNVEKREFSVFEEVKADLGIKTIEQISKEKSEIKIQEPLLTNPKMNSSTVLVRQEENTSEINQIKEPSPINLNASVGKINEISKFNNNKKTPSPKFNNAPATISNVNEGNKLDSARKSVNDNNIVDGYNTQKNEPNKLDTSRKSVNEKEKIIEKEKKSNSDTIGSLMNFNNPFEVTMPEYFSCSKETKYLHYFEENSKNLFLLDIEKMEDPNENFEKKTLNIDFFIPMKSRSLITPEGLIYLLGGYHNKENMTNTFLYDSFNQTLQPKLNMNYDRENFGVTYLLNQIYVCGGNDEYGNKLNVCERYDLFSNTWTKIAPLNQKVAGLYLTAFNEKFIFKFGGESTQTLLSQIIEIYELKVNKWIIIQAVSESNLIPVISRLGACVQLNEQNIFIFGGYYAKNDAGTNQSFLLEYNEKDNKQKFVIKRLNEKLLPHNAGFWNNMPFIYKKQVISLQNVPDPENKSISLQEKRRVLAFDSKEWKKIK